MSRPNVYFLYSPICTFISLYPQYVTLDTALLVSISHFPFSSSPPLGIAILSTVDGSVISIWSFKSAYLLTTLSNIFFDSPFCHLPMALPGDLLPGKAEKHVGGLLLAELPKCRGLPSAA